MIKVYHNPRCSKSRECMAFLENAGNPYEIIEYLKDTTTFDELKEIIRKLAVKPIAITRTSEPLWIAKFADKKLSGERLIKVLVKNPILIQRPIVVNGDKAIIARPLEKAAEIL